MTNTKKVSFNQNESKSPKNIISKSSKTNKDLQKNKQKKSSKKIKSEYKKNQITLDDINKSIKDLRSTIEKRLHKS